MINDVVFHGGRFVSTSESIDTNQEGWELRVKVMELHNSTTIRELGRRGHRMQRSGPWDHGRVLAVARHPETGLCEAAASPLRRFAYSATQA